MNEPLPVSALSCCQPIASPQRLPLAEDAAIAMEHLFKIMANSTRLRMINAIAANGEICVTDLAAALDTTPQAVSNQLQRLVDRGMLGSQRRGSHIFYRVVNPCVVALLDYGLCILSSTTEEPK